MTPGVNTAASAAENAGTPQGVLDFWFTELEPKMWWARSEQLDSLIAGKFGKLHARAAACELYPWRDTATGSLAEIIVLDQFSRNIFRDRAQAFAQDALALALSQTAIRRGFDRKLSDEQRLFLYMPFMHSESAAIHEQAVRLYTALGRQDNLDFEIRHKAIIDRFGRYPHRNQILGRQSTPEEIAFLQQPGSSF